MHTFRKKGHIMPSWPFNIRKAYIQPHTHTVSFCLWHINKNTYKYIYLNTLSGKRGTSCRLDLLIYINIYTHIQPHNRTMSFCLLQMYKYMYMHTHLQDRGAHHAVFIFQCIWIYIHIYMYTTTHSHTIFLCISSIHLNMYMYIYIYIYICFQIYTFREGGHIMASWQYNTY